MFHIFFLRKQFAWNFKSYCKGKKKFVHSVLCDNDPFLKVQAVLRIRASVKLQQYGERGLGEYDGWSKLVSCFFFFFLFWHCLLVGELRMRTCKYAEGAQTGADISLRIIFWHHGKRFLCHMNLVKRKSASEHAQKYTDSDHPEHAHSVIRSFALHSNIL